MSCGRNHLITMEILYTSPYTFEVGLKFLRHRSGFETFTLYQLYMKESTSKRDKYAVCISACLRLEMSPA